MRDSWAHLSRAEGMNEPRYRRPRTVPTFLAEDMWLNADVNHSMAPFVEPHRSSGCTEMVFT